MNKSYLTLSKISFALSDLVLLNFCLLISCYFSGLTVTLFAREALYNLAASDLIWILYALLFNLYSEQTLVKYKTVKRATLRSAALYLITFHSYMEFFSTGKNGMFLMLFYAVVILSFMLSRAIYTLFEALLLSLIDQDEAVNVFAIASIGGHWVQLLRLMPLFSTNNVSFLSTKPSLEETVSGHRYYLVPDANRKNKVGLVKCCLSIGSKIVFARPKVIVTTGAAPGLFGIFIGKILGVKTVWIDSIANVEKLSLSGKIASKIADRVYTQWEHLATPHIIFAGNILDA